MKKEFIETKQLIQFEYYEQFLRKEFMDANIYINERNYNLPVLIVKANNNFSFNLIFLPNVSENFTHIQLLQYTASFGILNHSIDKFVAMKLVNSFNELSASGTVFINDSNEVLIKYLIPIDVFEHLDNVSFIEITNLFFLNCNLFSNSWNDFLTAPQNIDSIIKELVV
jgi:hypothetical protein